MSHHLLIYRIDMFYEPKIYLPFWIIENRPKMSEKCEKCTNIWFEPLYIHSSMEFHQKKYIDLFYNIYLIYLPARVCEKVKNCIQKVKIDGIFPNRQAETPKEKRLAFGLELGYFCLCYRVATGVTNLGTYWKWIFNDLWRFFENFVTTAVC